MCVFQGYLLSMLLYNIRGIQIGGHDTKIVNFADNAPIFLRYITCLNRMEVILKPYENAKIN